MGAEGAQARGGVHLMLQRALAHIEGYARSAGALFVSRRVGMLRAFKRTDRGNHAPSLRVALLDPGSCGIR